MAYTVNITIAGKRLFFWGLKMNKCAFTVLVLLSVSGMCLSDEPELRGAPDKLAEYLNTVPEKVMLTGESEVIVTADRVIFTLSLSAEDDSLEQALKEMSRRKKKILSALALKGIPEKNISSLALPAIPLYRPETEESRERYKVADIIRVHIENETQYTGLASLIDSSDEIMYEGIMFELTDEAGYKEEALNRACDEIDMKKQVYIDKLGVRLVLKSISEKISVGTGEKINVEGNIPYGVQTDFNMGLFVFRAEVTAEYIIGE
jgi:uncharacterized protein YggE